MERNPVKFEFHKPLSTAEGIIRPSAVGFIFHFAASQYNDVDFGQILYAGDSLAGDKWDNRGWADKTDIRDFILRQALDCCVKCYSLPLDFAPVCEYNLHIRSGRLEHL